LLRVRLGNATSRAEFGGPEAEVEEQTFAELLTFENANAYFDRVPHWELYKKREFPSGFVKVVAEEFSKRGASVEVVDERVVPCAVDAAADPDPGGCRHRSATCRTGVPHREFGGGLRAAARHRRQQ